MLETIFQVIPIIGLGSLVTIVVQNWFKKRESLSDRVYAEKREVYVGILEAISQVAQNRSAENLARLSYWRIRCELVASKTARKAISERLDSDGGDPKLHETFVSELRKDLGVVK